MGTDGSEHLARRCGQRHGPVRRLHRRQQREPRSEQISTACDVQPATRSDDRPQASELGKVTARHFEDGEAPEPPTVVALGGASGQVLVLERVDTEADNHKQVGRGFVPECECVKHRATVGSTSDMVSDHPENDEGPTWRPGLLPAPPTGFEPVPPP